MRQKNINLVNENHHIYKDELRVEIDSIKVSGDLLSFTGSLEGGRVQATYVLNSKEEQEFFQNHTGAFNLSVDGELSLGESARNFGNFDYRNYLETHQFLGSLRISKINNFTHGSRFGLRRLRRIFLVHLQEVFPAPLSHYMAALLFGFQTREFDESREIFRTLGILHFFTLSGMQVNFFLESFKKFLLRLGVSLESSFWLLLVFSGIYFALAGFSTSVLRALLQTCLRQANTRFSWQLSGQSVFGLVVFASLIARPHLFLTLSGQLSYGIGFLISFLAPASRRFHLKWQQTLLMSFGISLGILPLIWWHFYEWNPFSLLLTILLIPVFQSVLLPSMVFAFFLSFVFPLAFLNLPLLLMEKLLGATGKFIGGPWIVGRPDFLVMILLFFNVFFGIYLLEKKKFSSLFLPLSIFLLAAGISVKRPVGMLAMVDVGQGDSFFIQTPFGKETSLIDVGGRVEFPIEEEWRQRNIPSNASRTLIPFLKARGVRRIDHLYLSHAHVDHYGDIVELAQTIEIKRIYFPDNAQNNPAFYRMLEKLHEKKIQLIPLSAPKELHEGFLLHPNQPQDGGNNDSLVIYRKFYNLSFLFTGDLEEEGENELIRRFPDLKIDILKAGHHGSKTSSRPAFIDHIKPSLVLISAGRNNRFNHPSPETLETLEERGIPSLKTNEKGMIYFNISPISGRLSAPISVKYGRIEINKRKKPWGDVEQNSVTKR